MPAPILGSNGLGETWSAFGTLALVRGDEESEPEAIEGIECSDHLPLTVLNMPDE